MTLGLLLTLLGIAAVAIGLLVWLWPNRTADLTEIRTVQQRRNANTTRLNAIDGEIAKLIDERSRITGGQR